MNKGEKTAFALAYLIAEKLSGGKAQIPAEISVSDVFALARAHGLGALCASALSDIGLCDENMSEHRARSVRKIILLDAERRAISDSLTERGIAHLPLKGVLLKSLYPSVGDREMSDNDILIDSPRRAEVREIFTQRGYETKSYGGSHDDVYMKKPVYNFEMHVSLFNDNENPRFAKYFEGALDRSACVSGEMREMEREDFYLYLTAHEYKHYSHGGTGIRSLLDAYLYLEANPDMDMNRIDEGLSALGIAEYEKSRRDLAKKLFDKNRSRELMLGEASLSVDEKRMLSYFIGSGVYGTEKNRIENELERAGGGSRIRYVFRRIFPKMEWYEANAPTVYKHKILIPFYVVKRLLVNLILSPAKIWRELKTIKKVKGKENGVSREK